MSVSGGEPGAGTLHAASLIVTIPVRDRARAAAFYLDVLGLAYVDQSAAGALLRTGSGLVLLYESTAPPPTHTLAGFEVPALEPAMASLRAAGVAFEEYDFPGLQTVDGIAWIGPERAAWFRDSEGSILSISEPWIEAR